jgi:hypothetical protein
VQRGESCADIGQKVYAGRNGETRSNLFHTLRNGRRAVAALPNEGGRWAQKVHLPRVRISDEDFVSGPAVV